MIAYLQALKTTELLTRQVVNIGSTLGVIHRMWTQEEKLQIVLLHLDQNIPTKVLSERFGVNRSLLCVWCKQYAEYGAERLRSQNGIPRLQPTAKKENKMSYEYIPKMDTDFVNKIIGQLIREFREKAGYSQNSLSKKSGLSQQHISQVELGKRNIGSDQLVKLGMLLGFSLNDIQERLTTPPTAVTAATADDFPAVRQFDSHITEDKLISCINNNQVYAIWTPDKMVGICRYSFFWQSIPFLDLLYIDEPYRGRGFGTTLTAHWENAMKALGHKHVMLSTQENESARFFYEKLGYRCVGSFLPPDQDFEELMYVKELSE